MKASQSPTYNDTEIHAVLFDLDGTLYSQRKMHLYMLGKLISYYIIRPHKLHELLVIYYFRKKRYSLLDVDDLNKQQYSIVAKHLNMHEHEVRRIIAFWMEEQPLHSIKKCRYSYIPDLFQKIRSHAIKIAVVSDYPVEKKLRALDLTADTLISSTDAEVNVLKPNPKGFLLAAKKIGVEPKHCLVIGDRDDKDGQGARNAGMQFLMIDKNVLDIF